MVPVENCTQYSYPTQPTDAVQSAETQYCVQRPLGWWFVAELCARAGRAMGQLGISRQR